METKVEFEDIVFKEIKDPKKGLIIRAEFMKNYYFDLNPVDLRNISEYKIVNGDLFFNCSEKKAYNKMNLLINSGLSSLIHRVRNKETIYIHSQCGIPLIGTNEFGIVDRGTNIIEVKPLTGCNLSCTFCSVKEGKNDKKDIVIQEEYLVEEFAKLAAIKEHPIEANIGPQGEPLLYPKLVELVKDLNDVPNVNVISINTNGLTLNPKLVDELASAGLNRINLSLHALDKKLACELADGPYNLDNLLKMIKYCEGKIDVLLAPVLIPGFNEQEFDDIIELAKTIKNKKYPSIGIQNYLNYKGGRNITEQMPWEDFNTFLEKKQKEHDFRLILDQSAFNIQYDKTLPKPFKKGQIITVSILSVGRKANELLCEAKERCVTVYNSKKSKGKIRVKLIRDKHNIFTAIPA